MFKRPVGQIQSLSSLYLLYHLGFRNISLTISLNSNQKIEFEERIGLEPGQYKIDFERLENFLDRGKPILNLDILRNEQKAIEEIVEISYSDLKKLGFILTALKPLGWEKGRRVVYALSRLGTIPQSRILPGIPDGHIVEYDRNNSRVRLVGKNAGLGGTSSWIVM